MWPSPRAPGSSVFARLRSGQRGCGIAVAKSPWHQEKSSGAPSQAIRDFGVKLKLNPVRYLLQGKRVVLVDDSIVRGTTSRKIVRMVRQAGAREIHLRISCPPTISPC